MKKLSLLAGLLLCGLFSVHPASACTTFVLQGDGRIYFGRNLDWHWESGLVVVNQRNVGKIAIVDPGHAPAKWVSKYGSVTFNQFGLELPMGGMNEAGLVVENMWLDETKYPASDARPGINLSQWIEYQLDNCRTVDEVLATDKKIRLEPLSVPAGLHYLVCDANGDCATVEFLNGKMVAHHHDKLPFRVLANDQYEESADYARKHPDTADGKPLSRPTSLARFDRAAACVAAFKPAAPGQDVAYAFNSLNQVRQMNTVWQIVYDVTGQKIHFRTHRNEKERTVDLKALDFACGHPVQFADIEAKPSGQETVGFQSLSEPVLQKYLAAFYSKEQVKQLFGDLTPKIGLQLMALHNYSCFSQ